MRNLARMSDHFHTELQFMDVYNSEFCRESKETIYYDWDYAEFIKTYNTVKYMEEFKYAQQLDMSREEELEQNRNRQGRGF